MSEGSFKRIDYSLRPAKHAERRMLNDVFRRLRPFGPVENYRYVGLGSLWFSDFVLFHRTLGIRDMLSIERDKAQEARFRDNKPYRTINMDFRESSAVLGDLEWPNPALVWLDYDDPIAAGMLLDIGSVATRVTTGTVMAVTVQCQRAREIQQSRTLGGDPAAIEMFKSNLGVRAVPTSASEEDLEGWPFGALSREIFASQIESALGVRNLGVVPGQQIEFTPICDIEYMDGAKMTTFVGIFATVDDRDRVRDCGFDTLDFLPANSRRIRIEVPVLTVREIRELERQLPLGGEPLVYGSIPQGHADKFAKFYRYLPNFAVLEQ